MPARVGNLTFLFHLSFKFAEKVFRIVDQCINVFFEGIYVTKRILSDVLKKDLLIVLLHWIS